MASDLSTYAMRHDDHELPKCKESDVCCKSTDRMYWIQAMSLLNNNELLKCKESNGKSKRCQKLRDHV